MIYVASPYSSSIPELQQLRYERVREFTHRLVARGFVAFSPILYCHPIAAEVGLATDAKTWFHFNMTILRRAESCWILQLPGWESSKGVQYEIKVCDMLSILKVHYDADFRLVDRHMAGHVPEKF